MQILQEAVRFGCRNCPNDAEREAENIKLTRQNVEVFRRFLFCDDITEVQIIIRPKKGKDVKDFRFYEFIPKTCIDDLNKYLDENSLEGEHYVNGDPLIVWHFSDLGEETKISYRLNASFDEECKQAVKGLGIAQFVEQKENLNAPVQKKILKFKSSSEEFKGESKTIQKNLWDSTDYNGRKEVLVYRIASQNANLAKCEIKNVKILDCERKQDNQGISEVLIEVSDGTLTNRGTVTINAGPRGAAAAANTAPTIGGLPSVKISGTGLKKNVITDLGQYAQDKETTKENLVYSILDQTNPKLVGCKITNEKNVDCNVNQYKQGTSRVTIQVSDTQLTDKASFDVRVSLTCQKHEKKGCVGTQVYWFDDCGNLEEFDKFCGSREICQDGECKGLPKECEEGSVCGFLKFGNCKNGQCCQLDAINPFC